MKKNALLTFLFALIPGAGQMYYGYMQRGLSLITMFCLACGLTFTLRIELLIFIAGIVWMYSFFDTYDLLRYAAAGTPKEDGLLLLSGSDSLKSLKKLAPRSNKLLGWILIALGLYGVYELLLSDILIRALEWLLGGYTWEIVHNIPGVLVSVLFILAGAWLLGLRPAKAQPPQELPPYPQAPGTYQQPAAPAASVETPIAPVEPAAPTAQDAASGQALQDPPQG